MFLSSLDTEEQRSFLLDVYIKYYGLLMDEALKLVQDRSVAEDLVHDAFLRVAKYISRIRGLDCCVLPTYLVSIIRSVCYSYLVNRKQGNTHGIISFDILDDRIADPNVNIELQALEDFDMKRLQLAMALLPPLYRDVLNFKYLLEMSNDAIGKTLGIKSASVRQYLTRARRRCYDIAMGLEESRL